MQNLTQCQLNVISHCNTRKVKDLARIDEFTSVQDILRNWYFHDLLTPTQQKKAKSGAYDFETLKGIVLEREEKRIDKDKEKALAKLDAIYQAEPLNFAVFRIDWVKSRTWGMCPRGSYSNGYAYKEYKSITGCGFDKLSTLTASMLNDDLHALKHLVTFIDSQRLTTLAELGSGHGASCFGGVPYFNDGVGISSHISLFKLLGFKVVHNETKTSDFISIDED